MSLQKIAAKMIEANDRVEQLAAQLLEALKAECARTSQNKVAQKLGVSAPYLSDVIKGNRAAGVSLARRVVEAFGEQKA